MEVKLGIFSMRSIYIGRCKLRIKVFHFGTGDILCSSTSDGRADVIWLPQGDV